MKKWKTALTIVPLVLLISVALYFIPTIDLVKNIPVLKAFYKNTTLEIVTPNGKADVVINGKDYGTTPVNIENLIEGNYEVTLTRSGADTSFYKPQTFNIELIKNTTSRISMEIGPEDFIYGTVMYYTRDSIYTNSKGKLSITSDTSDAKIYIDEEFLKSTPLTNMDLNPGEYEILIEADNYTPIELPIVVREGLTLNVKGYLLPIPVTFEEAKGNE